MRRRPAQPANLPVRSGLLQRKCACGGAKSPSRDCIECRRKKKLDLQTKLQVNRPGDRYEREADRVAERVMRSTPLRESLPILTSPMIQREAGGEAGTAPAVVHEAIAEPGQALDEGARAFMEPRFGHDFSRVRIHYGTRAVEAARAVAARAFTVGNDVVFGTGQYAPGTHAGRRLLAHELTHVAQQNGPASHPLPDSGAAGVLQREPDDTGVPSPDAPAPDAMTSARSAEERCDIAALCRIKRTNPGAVTDAQIQTVTRRCRPRLSPASPLPPCLNPAALMPPSALVPGKAPACLTPAPTTPPPTTGLPDLSRFTKFTFNLGDATLSVELPKSATFKLPVALRGAYRITFSLKAETSGKFTFTVTLDGLPHIQIKASSSVDVSGESGSSSLTVSSTWKTCHAPNALETKTALESAGTKLKEALVNFKKPIDPKNEEILGKRLVNVVGGIAEVYSAVEKAKGKCTPTSVLEFGLQSQYPLTKESETVPSVGLGFTFRF